MFSKAMRNDERHRRSPGFYGGFRGCGTVVRLLRPMLWLGPFLHPQRSFPLQPSHQALRSRAVVFIDYQYIYFGRGVTLPAENHGKDAEEPDRQDKTQRPSSAVAAQADQCGAHDGKNQSRNSLPVKCRNTDSRLGFRSEMSASSCPARAAESSNPAISVACSMVNCAIPFS